MEESWRATHVVPVQGVETWSEPDPAKASSGRLEGGVELVLESLRGDWAHVRGWNGWVGWVDARLLVPMQAARVPAAAAPAAAPTAVSPAGPEAASRPTPAVPSGDGRRSRRPRSRWLVATAAVVVVALVAGVLALRGGGGSGGGGAGTGGDQADTNLVRGHLGEPAIFVRNFGGPEVTAQPAVDTWVYPANGASFVFVDGHFSGHGELADLPPTEAPAVAAPEDFSAGMAVADVEAALGGASEASIGWGPYDLHLWPTGQAMFEEGGLVMVYVGPRVGPEVVQGTGEEASGPAPGPPGQPAAVPRRGVPPASVSLPVVRAAPIGSIPVTAPLSGGAKDWMWSILENGKKGQNASGTLDLIALQQQLNGGIAFLEGEEQRLTQLIGDAGTPALQQAQYEEAVGHVRQLLDQLRGMHDDLPRARGMIDALLPWWNPVTLADASSLQERARALGEYLGGTGSLTTRLTAFLDDYTGDWGEVPADLRRSLLLAVMEAEIFRQCGRPQPSHYENRLAGGRGDTTWGDCVVRALNRLRRELRDAYADDKFPPATNDDCLDELEALDGLLFPKPPEGDSAPASGSRYHSVRRVAGPTPDAEEGPRLRVCKPRGPEPEPAVAFGVFIVGGDVMVGSQDGIENRATCSLVGWGLDCKQKVIDVTTVRLAVGPYESSAEATEAYCEALDADSVHTIPLVAGGLRATFSFGGPYAIDNAPGCG